MRGRARIAAVAVLALLVGAGLWWVWGRDGEEKGLLTGYIEGDQLYLSSPVAGTVEQVWAEEGRRVTAGQRVFAMDAETATAAEGQARARLGQAEAQIATSAARASQARANIEAVRAAEALARKDLARFLQLQRDNPAAIAKQQIDQARATVQSASAQRAAAERAALAQTTEIGSARASAAQAQAALQEQSTRLGQLSGVSPAAGRVEEVFYQPGEWAAANQPVVSILPDAKVKLRFFVPETGVQHYRVGTTVRFTCDSCRGRIPARITYVSPRPEFTPPVIYSRETRDKLVFMVEAIPQGGASLSPGVPIDVEPAGGAAR